MKKVDCPMCHGMGGQVEPVLDYGEGPWEYCGYCKGTGQMWKTKLYYQCLGWLSASSKFKKKMRQQGQII